MRQAGAKAPACIFGTAAPRFAARALVGWTFHPHISGMALPRRISAFLPFGRVAALVAVLLLVGMSGAWALDFPRLGLPGTAQENIMQTGFAVQWSLFGGFSGAKGNALYYLALTAGVIGLMLVVTNAKYRSPPVLISWFIILLLLLFAPYKSRLLFYPVAPGGGECTSGVTSKVDSASGALSSLNGVCGFTPQVIVSHVGTVMTLIMTDVFQNMGLQNEVEAAMAGNRVRNAPQMVANEDARNALNSYDKTSGCADTAPILPARMQDTSSSVPSGGGGSGGTETEIPRTMETMFNQIRDQAVTAKPNTKVSLPGIVLPRSYSEGQAYGWDSQKWAQYVNGVSHIYARVVGDGKTVVNTQTGEVSATNTMVNTQTGEVSATNTIGQDQAVDQILSTIANNGAAGSVGAMSYYLTAPSGNGAELWKQVRTNSVGKTGNEGSTATQFNVSGNNKERPIYMRTLADLIQNDDVVRTMPVGKASSTSNLASCSGAGIAQKCEQKIDNNVKDCKVEAANMFTHLVERQFNQLGREGSSGVGKRLVNIMQNGGTIEAKELMNASGPYADLAKSLALWLGTNDGNGNISGDDLARYFSEKVTTSARQNPDPAAAVGKQADAQPKNMGATSFFADPIAALGILLAGLAGKLSGALAAGFLVIIKSLIDLTIMVMLVVTPLMFLMGLLIPTNAPGMLFVTTVGLLVLKLVPMTTVIIDFMVGLARTMSWGTSGNIFSAAAWDGIILGAAAGMYMGVISFTMFIMFKLGDPSNISQLRGLESAGKQIAEVGKKALIALGVGAATLGAGAAVGGISGGRAAARMAMSGTRLGKASEMLENLKASSEAKTEAATAAEAPVTGGTPTDGVKPGIPEVDITGDPAAEFARREADAAKAFGEDGLTQEMGKDAGGWQNVNGAFAEHLDMGGDPDGPRKVKTANGRTYTAELKDGKWVATGFEEGLPEGDTKLAQQVASLKNGEQATVTLSDGSTQTWARDENGALARVASTEAPAPGKDATVPAPTVVPTATGAGTVVRTPAGYVSEADAERFDALSKDNRATVEGLANGEKAEVTLSDKTTRTWERTDEGKLKQRASVEDDKHFKDFSDKLDRISTSIRDAIKQGFDQATMNRLSEDNKDAPLQSNAAFKAEIEALVNADVLSQAQAKKILNSSSYDEAFKEVSDVRARQTEYLQKIGVAKNGDNFDGASAAWRGGLKGARSGLYGSIQAFKNAGGSLPVIGPIIKEILNEDREAHDRAVVIAMAGGMKDYKRSQKLAERNSFVNKEMSTLGGAESYRNNLVQAQYSNTIQAARQGAAKAVEDFTARARTGRTDSTGAFSFSDMRANARMGAVSEATSISTGAMSIKNANITLQGGRSVSLNPAVLQELGMRASLGDANKKIGGQFETSYAMEPKLDKRGVNDLRDGKQIGDYVQGSTGRDYVVSGVINNMSGRAAFMAKEAEALRMLEFAKGNMNSSELNKYFSMGAELKAARNYQKFMNPMAKHTRDDLAEILADFLDKNE